MDTTKIIVWVLPSVTFIAGYFIRGLIDRHFKRSDVKWMDKRELAKVILNFVDEGQNHRYKHKLTSDKQQKAENASSLAKAYSKEIDSEFRSFLGFWNFININYHIKIPEFQEGEHIKNNIWLVREADENAERVRNLVEKWLK